MQNNAVKTLATVILIKFENVSFIELGHTANKSDMPLICFIL